MAFNDLASNQLVSFTNAQTSGAPLLPSQSNVNSNEIMTKADLVAKYSVLPSNSTLSPKSSNQCVAARDFTPVPLCNAATYTRSGTIDGNNPSCGQVEYWVYLGTTSGNVTITFSNFSSSGASFPSNGVAFRVDYGSTNLINTTIYNTTQFVFFSYTYNSGTGLYAKITVGSACP